MNSKIEELRWKKFPVLDDGFVTLVDVMGDDVSIVQAARVSYGKDVRVGGDEEHPDPNKDRDLLRYLMRHRHSTPFEMAEVKLLVRVPMDCWRQWIRHRTANVNEYSTRYSEAIDSMQKTPPDQWRPQSVSNKQGSTDGKIVWPDDAEDSPMTREWTAGEWLSQKEKDLQRAASEVYQERLSLGVAREQARKDLPLSTYTEAYWKCDLHNILGFLALRMDSHAQLEIRQYANTIGEQIIAPLFPCVWEAFQDYRLQALQLTRLDIVAIQMLQHVETGAAGLESILAATFTNKREREECEAKLKRLGLIV